MDNNKIRLYGKGEIILKIKQIIAALTAAAAMLMTGIPVRAGILDKWETPAFDTEGAVQTYRYDSDSGKYYGDSDKNKLDGLVYADMSNPEYIWSDLRMIKFNDGQIEKYYTGFTSSSLGKRYYTYGKRAFGWQKIKDNWYHFDLYTGYMSTGRTKICGTSYLFGNDGKWTGKLDKSGFVPKDFSVKFYASLSETGFDTADNTIFYGSTFDGTATGNIKIPAKDKQVLYCMLLESEFEGSHTFEERYIADFVSKIREGENEYYQTEPGITYTITVENYAEISYNFDVEQISVLDSSAFRSTNLFRAYESYYYELLEKYPYEGGEELFFPE